MIDKPLYQNPLGGGLGNMIERPGGGNVPRGGFNNNSLANSIIGNGFYELNKNLIEGGGYLNETPLPQPTEGVSQDVFGNPNYLDGTTSVNPIVTGPQEIASAETNPYNRVGQQLTGPNQFNNQFSSMGDRLTKLEEGIASLLNQNRGFGFNSMQPRYGAPNYGYSPFSMTGLGSLFGGYYG